MKQLVLLCFALLVAASCTCCVDTRIPKTIAPAETKDQPSGKQPGNHKNNMPVMGSCQVIGTKVEEVSGLCMNKDTTGFWAVGDQGDLCQVSFSGTVSRVLRTRLDMEGITIDPETKTITTANTITIKQFYDVFESIEDAVVTPYIVPDATFTRPSLMSLSVSASDVTPSARMSAHTR